MSIIGSPELLKELKKVDDGVQLVDDEGNPCAIVLTLKEYQRLLDAGDAIIAAGKRTASRSPGVFPSSNGQ